MRKSLFVGVLLALSIVAFDLESFFKSKQSISINYAVAQEMLPDFSATTTLSVADVAVWNFRQEVANNEADELAPAIPSPTSAAADTHTIRAKKAPVPRPTNPLRVSIPSIGLDSTVVPVGLNRKGEMDVPSGKTNNVGWYKSGPKPSEMGSSVLDAHVFAAFKELHRTNVGDEIIVETESGQRLRFIVEETTVYKLSEMTPSMLFGRGGGRWLNLITCAGVPVGDTYSHRLVVYARFVEEL